MTTAVQIEEICKTEKTWQDEIPGEDQIVKAHEAYIKGFVRKIKRQMLWNEPEEDLRQEAVLVLIRLIRTSAYDPTRNTNFKTFFYRCLYRRFRTLALNLSTYTSHVTSFPDLDFESSYNEDLGIQDLIEVLELKVSDISRKILGRRLSEQQRVTLSTLCDELKCSMAAAKKATAEIRRVFGELNV